MSRFAFACVAFVALVAFALTGCSKNESTETLEPAPPAPADGAPATSAAPAQPAETEPAGAIHIKVGVTIPKTGEVATYGDEADKGIALAVKDAKAEGKVWPTTLVVDNGGTQQQTATSVKKFIDSDKVSAILGPITTNNTIQAGDLVEAAGVPLISPSATNVDVTKNRKYVFRVCFTDDVQGRTVANFAFDTGARKAGLLVNSNEAYSRGLADVIAAQFKGRSGKIVSTLSFTKDTDDFSGQITQLRLNSPDVVFLPAYYEQVAKCIAQARAAGLRAKFVGTDGWDSPDLYTISNGAVKGNYFSSHFSPLEDRPIVKRFVENYRAAYRKEPGAIAALSYDAAALLFDATKRAGSADRQAVTTALAATKDFEGVTGKFSIDQNHNPVKAVFILETGQSGATIKQIINP